MVIENSLITVIPAAFVFAAVLRLGDRQRKKLFIICCAAGSFAALVFSVLRRTTAINRGMVNTVVLSIALVTGIAFLVCHWLKKSKAVQKGALYSGALLAGALFFYALPPLFLLPSDFVMAGQSVFSTEFLVNLTGALAGLAIVLFAGYMIFHAGTQTARAHNKDTAEIWFNLCLNAVFVFNMVNQATNVIQFLMARRIIPLNRGMFRVIMLVMNNQRFFIFMEIGIAAILPLVLLLQASFPTALSSAKDSAEPPPNPAVIRKQKAFVRRSRRRNMAAVALLGFSVFALTGLKAWNDRAVVLSPAEPFTLAGEEIVIPVTQIEDGHLHRFAWNALDNTEVRFIVVKKSVSAWGVGLDACDICGNTGYYERRDGIVCRLCDVVMNKSTIGFKGGCNPVPLAYTVRDGAMVIRLRDLEQEIGRFK
jgi:uncharacterized membrane protein